jgi:hypothetical protein
VAASALGHPRSLIRCRRLRYAATRPCARAI